ncbi:MAG TPA: hypothetical protein VHV55_16450 [Pirellulales bacterium]|nr:hypothetical protein [Pirellulales bacterium]
MIYDSSFWKRDLLKTAATMRKWDRKRSWGEPSLARLEQLVMLGFYSIRKLSEAQTLSTATMTQPIALVCYPAIGRAVTLRNWHRVDELYDFGSPSTVSKDLVFVCHQIVHSYVFMPVVTERDRLEAIWFCSDRFRNKCLFSLDVTRLIELLEEVGKDYPAKAHLKFNQKTQDYDVVSS